MAKDPITQAKADRNDLRTAMTVGALIIGVLAYDSIQRVIHLFSIPGAVTVTTPVPTQQITAAIGEGAPASVDTAALVVEGANTVSVVCLVLAIVLRALCLIAVAALGVVVCRRLLRGIVFDSRNTRLTFFMSMGLLVAAVGGPWLETMGLNGVFAAVGGEFGDGRWLLFRDGTTLFVAAIAVGVLVIVFRRGTRLAKETEGLV